MYSWKASVETLSAFYTLSQINYAEPQVYERQTFICNSIESTFYEEINLTLH